MTTRQQTIAALADISEIPKNQAETVIKDFESIITSALMSGDGKFELKGIGVIKVKSSKARIGRNPKTGEPIQIAAKRSITISPSKAIKEALNP